MKTTLQIRKLAITMLLMISMLFPSYTIWAKDLSQSLLIRSAGTSRTEFAAYKKTELIKTYAQYQLDILRKTARPIPLSSTLQQAQIEFLSHEPNDSKKSFTKITEHIHDFDWNTEERKIIFYSLIRLAQLTKNNQKKKLLLQEAFGFGMGLEPDLKVFPPPLIKLYTQIKQKTNFISMDLKKIFPSYEIILINGKVFSKLKKVNLPYGIYRITALSSSRKSWGRVLSLSRLISKKIKTPFFTEGTCENPLINHLSKNFLKKQQVQILFPNFCVWNSAQLPLIKTSNKILPSEGMLDDTKLAKAVEKQPQWWEERWIWLSVALVLGVSSVIVLSGDKPQPERKSPEIKPKVKFGF